jgi:ribosomal protein S18 acetylase RimI-like enzyme
MADFPTGFDAQSTPLTASRFSEADAALVNRLAEDGYEIHVGLTRKFAGDIAEMCRQPSIKEYCPNDSGKRFKDAESTETWLGKGRATFLLLKRGEDDELDLVGYGWAGGGASPHAPGGTNTFALRIGETGQGKGLATPFSRLILAGTTLLYGAKDFWLETWQSNAGAVHVYHKIGFRDVHEEAGERPTSIGASVEDIRLFMELDNELLPD